MNAGVRRSFVDCDGRLTILKPEDLCDCTVRFLLQDLDRTGVLGMAMFTNGNVLAPIASRGVADQAQPKVIGTRWTCLDAGLASWMSGPADYGALQLS